MTTTTTTAFGARVGTHAGGEFFQSKSDKSLLGGRGSVASTSRRRFDDDDLLDHHFGKRYGGGGRIGVVEAFGRSRRRRRSARFFSARWTADDATEGRGGERVGREDRRARRDASFWTRGGERFRFGRTNVKNKNEGRGQHATRVKAKATTELERDRLDIEISNTWDESMDEFDFDEDGQLKDAFGNDIDMTQVKKAIPGDFYSLIQVPRDATPAEIKKAYRRLQKACHPDIAGEAGSDVCTILNEAYDVLMNDNARAAYDAEMKELERMTQEFMKRGATGDDEDDEQGGYTGEPLSKYKGKDPAAGYPRAVFVNECLCIGCKQCCHSAPKTFAMDEQYGRARVFAQWDDEEEDINVAIESCPVDCIHFVKENNLPILEYAMTKCERTSVASMMSGSARIDDPFDVANQMIRRGEERYGRLGLDPNDALKGKSLVGKMKKRIRDAWLQLGEKPRLAWTSYKIFKGFGSEDEEYEVSMDDGEVRRKEEKKEETKKKSKWFNFST